MQVSAPEWIFRKDCSNRYPQDILVRVVGKQFVIYEAGSQDSGLFVLGGALGRDGCGWL